MGGHVQKGCAPPNAVYGIETSDELLKKTQVSLGSCAPPNAVYGIETVGVFDIVISSEKNVVRRLMPFTALKPGN